MQYPSCCSSKIKVCCAVPELLALELELLLLEDVLLDELLLEELLEEELDDEPESVSPPQAVNRIASPILVIFFI